MINYNEFYMGTLFYNMSLFELVYSIIRKMLENCLIISTKEEKEWFLHYIYMFLETNYVRKGEFVK